MSISKVHASLLEKSYISKNIGGEKNNKKNNFLLVLKGRNPGTARDPALHTGTPRDHTKAKWGRRQLGWTIKQDY